MREEISAARRIILDFVRSEEDLNEIRCYILVPFDDHGSVYNSKQKTQAIHLHVYILFIK